MADDDDDPQEKGRRKIVELWRAIAGAVTDVAVRQAQARQSAEDASPPAEADDEARSSDTVTTWAFPADPSTSRSN